MNTIADAEQIILLGIALAIGLLGGGAGLLSQYLEMAAFGLVFLGFTIGPLA